MQCEWVVGWEDDGEGDEIFCPKEARFTLDLSFLTAGWNCWHLCAEHYDLMVEKLRGLADSDDMEDPELDRALRKHRKGQTMSKGRHIVQLLVTMDGYDDGYTVHEVDTRVPSGMGVALMEHECGPFNTPISIKAIDF